MDAEVLGGPRGCVFCLCAITFTCHVPPKKVNPSHAAWVQGMPSQGGAVSVEVGRLCGRCCHWSPFTPGNIPVYGGTPVAVGAASVLLLTEVTAPWDSPESPLSLRQDTEETQQDTRHIELPPLLCFPAAGMKYPQGEPLKNTGSFGLTLPGCRPWESQGRT